MNNTARDESFVASVVTVLLAGIAGVAGSYALAGYTRRFVAEPILSFLVQNMPAPLLQFAIGPVTQFGRRFGIGHLGQKLNLLLAVTLGVVLFAVLSFAALVAGRRFDTAVVSVAFTGVLVWLAATVLTGASVAAFGAGVASAIVVAVAVFATTTGDATGRSVSRGRREILGSFASAVGVGVIGYLLGTRSSSSSQPSASIGTNAGGNATDGANNGSSGNASNAGSSASAGTVAKYLKQAERRSFDVDNLEGLVSGEDFYEVDIKNINPQVNAADWSLSITGAVENEVDISYDELTSMDREFRFATLRCVSDPLNGKNMDNDLWTGVPMPRLLQKANPQGKYVMLRSVDSYYEETELETLRDGFLAYGKNGGPLPKAHGHPVRAVVGGHWGEISVKWIDEIEVIEGPKKGFWEKKGWHGTGPVNTVAKLHAENHLDNGKTQVAGTRTPEHEGSNGSKSRPTAATRGTTQNSRNPYLPGRASATRRNRPKTRGSSGSTPTNRRAANTRSSSARSMARVISSRRTTRRVRIPTGLPAGCRRR